MRHKQTEENKLSYFLSKAIFKTIVRIEKIGQIYYKHKIHIILICGMTKALEQDFQENKLSKLVERITFNSKLKILNETLSKGKIGKILIYHGLIDFTKHCLMTN